MIPMIFSRFRSIHFGKEDKTSLVEMINDIPFMLLVSKWLEEFPPRHCDETAIALLQNQNHPSDAFRERAFGLHMASLH